MATLVPFTTPARQPFGVLSDTKVRSLQSLKNRQNAITPSSVPSLKRRAPSPEMGSDSENIDPNMLDSLQKRKRSAFEDDVSASKASRYSLNVTSNSSTYGKRRLETPANYTPRLDTIIKPSATTLASAPAAAAGRSPTRRRSSLLKSSKRLNLPTFSVGTQPLSLSLSAALSGTKKSQRLHQSGKSQSRGSTIEDSKPQSWFFDIYEESEETQEYRMNEWTMTQTATGLDISDDESKAVSKSEKLDRGKENVDPNEQSAPVTRSMAAAAVARQEKDVIAMMDDEPRTPLADLNPAKFYAEGLDATSVVLVHDDDAETDIEEETAPAPRDFTFQAPASLTAKVIEDLNTPSLGEILRSATPYNLEASDAVPIEQSDFAAVENNGSEIGIEIWESESAKDENEKVEADVPFTPGSSGVGDENVFALQEL
ncbi:hypothetical protein, variant [Exophiala xenobiotica]|uniref:Uncharacterized protein n=1 Tax=Exophiala xenobiotica TaxID=348802 RepID=A0A0D2EH06_9EURO|nr:hypothetical protein, variant [Exophiala xenobiotica]XP_013314470.1 uncharacterized protein PV05_06295 [Exophiala xenobiotica]KIW53885.1 hypothetical protein PV05_06295 [Exophiala xenobiotica]KIW53886.1 hypothetical protein, variant [Exophiala xenobiotica]